MFVVSEMLAKGLGGLLLIFILVLESEICQANYLYMWKASVPLIK